MWYRKHVSGLIPLQDMYSMLLIMYVYIVGGKISVFAGRGGDTDLRLCYIIYAWMVLIWNFMSLVTTTFQTAGKSIKYVF